MLKKNKPTLILSTLVLLLPMVVGLCLWNTLPESVPLHWNAAGQVDGWGSRAQAVFMMPSLILAVHAICILAVAVDPKHKNTQGKALSLVLWISPVISLAISTLTYLAALGLDPSMEIILPLIMGLMFVILGNYLPKCRQNYTIGIRVRWTLADEANWNATHRFGGWVWVIGGIAIMATAALGNLVLFFALVLLMVLIPTLYSYLYFRKHKKGTAA